MISPELLRRYQFFAGFSHEQLALLAMSADEHSVGAAGKAQLRQEIGQRRFRDSSVHNDHIHAITAKICLQGSFIRRLGDNLPLAGIARKKHPCRTARGRQSIG